MTCFQRGNCCLSLCSVLCDYMLLCCSIVKTMLWEKVIWTWHSLLSIWVTLWVSAYQRTCTLDCWWGKDCTMISSEMQRNGFQPTQQEFRQSLLVYGGWLDDISQIFNQASFFFSSDWTCVQGWAIMMEFVFLLSSFPTRISVIV